MFVITHYKYGVKSCQANTNCSWSVDGLKKITVLLQTVFRKRNPSRVNTKIYQYGVKGYQADDNSWAVKGLHKTTVFLTNLSKEANTFLEYTQILRYGHSKYHNEQIVISCGLILQRYV